MESPFYRLTARTLEGRPFDFSGLRGKVVLVVNTASQCGFTAQYAGLEALYRKYKEQGFEIVAFTCNQFGHQEPGDASEISACTLRFHVTFPLMDKIDVNGKHAHPVYRFLKEQARGMFGTRFIKWNFTKFIVDREAQGIVRIAPWVPPVSFERWIKLLLEEA